MKYVMTVALGFALAASGSAYAQGGQMKGMEMKGADSQKCQEMMGAKGMDMKSMDMQKCQEMMGAKDQNQADKGATGSTHEADGTIKAIDKEKGKITLAHGPVKSLDWPAMNMAFSVKDRSMLDKLTVGQKVHVQFVKQGTDYTITSVK